MNRVHVLMRGQEDEKRETLFYDSQDAREQMLRARGQFKYLSNLVAAQESAATRKRLAAAAAAQARRDAAGGSSADKRMPGGQATLDSGKDMAAHAELPSAAHATPEDAGDVWDEVMMCPVCTDAVGSSASVMLPCGHLLCYQCCRDLVKVAFSSPLSSPVLVVCDGKCVCVRARGEHGGGRVRWREKEREGERRREKGRDGKDCKATDGERLQRIVGRSLKCPTCRASNNLSGRCGIHGRYQS